MVKRGIDQENKVEDYESCPAFVYQRFAKSAGSRQAPGSTWNALDMAQMCEGWGVYASLSLILFI